MDSSVSVVQHLVGVRCLPNLKFLCQHLTKRYCVFVKGYLCYDPFFGAESPVGHFEINRGTRDFTGFSGARGHSDFYLVWTLRPDLDLKSPTVQTISSSWSHTS